MRLETGDHRSSQSNERSIQEPANDHGLLTPARRAALDALEREFQELLEHAALAR